jgi:hypothetical protein
MIVFLYKIVDKLHTFLWLRAKKVHQRKVLKKMPALLRLLESYNITIKYDTQDGEIRVTIRYESDTDEDLNHTGSRYLFDTMHQAQVEAMHKLSDFLGRMQETCDRGMTSHNDVTEICVLCKGEDCGHSDYGFEAFDKILEKVGMLKGYDHELF